MKTLYKWVLKLCLAISISPCSYSIAQDTIFFEGFEASSFPNINFSTPPCSNLPDLWDTTSCLDTTQAFSGNYFWGIRDLNGNCGGNNFESLISDTFDLSNSNYANFSFRYCFVELDNGDDIKYSYSYDNNTPTEISLINGSSNISSNGWLTSTLNIPDSINTFSFTISIKQNGDNDYIGIDNLYLKAVHKDSCYISTPILNAFVCNNNGSNSNALDDKLEFDILCQGQNLSSSYQLFQNDSLLDDSLNFNNIHSIQSISGSIYSLNNFTVIDNINSSCTSQFTIDSAAHCSFNYQILSAAISSNNLSVNCDEGDSVLLSIQSFGIFDTTNNFSILLLDSTQNQFSSELYRLQSTSIDTQVYVHVPHALATSSAYEILVKSDFPNFSSTPISIEVNNTSNCSPPYITGILINACSSGIQEGSGELIFGYTGSYALDFNSKNFQFSYAANLPFSSSHVKIDSFENIPTNTLLLNSSAGCTNLFFDGYGQSIPSNSRFLICRNDVDINSLYWHNLCGLGPIYVLYANHTKWLNNGLFSNLTTSGTRYMQAKFTDTLNHEYIHETNYNRTLNSGLDGDFTTFNASGGTALSYENFGCNLVPGILPITLLNFELSIVESDIQISFELKDPGEYSSLTLEKYIHNEWVELETFNTPITGKTYRFEDQQILPANNYRLLGIQANGDSDLICAESIPFKQKAKKVIARTNLLGQSIKTSTKGWHFIIFEDGSTQLSYQP
ncbi:hypothetical protein [Lishizhenia sp.]|uniref:hypothetical protein n=1 Tax=Lishizhenia sp. TaxID=2497594 RepID=UPI00299DE74B|nr:hypothetical protein [Lishizhenia sp.]MDX1446542.1 hypothetical protein [Lishizhenia sp.]